MIIPEYLLLSAIALITTVIIAAGVVLLLSLSNKRKFPAGTIQDLEKRLEDMAESSTLNFDEFSEYMEQMTEHLEALAEKIMPRTIHVTHAETAIWLVNRVDVSLQTDVDSFTLQIDEQEDGLDETPAKGGSPQGTVSQPGSDITSTDQHVTISMPE